MDAKTVQQNEILEIAKKIASTTNELKQEKLSIKLGEVIAHNFENNNAKMIEEAVTLSIDEGPEITNIIMDEVHLEIEYICAEDEQGNEIDSTMQVMPISIVSKAKTLELPSIKTFEQTIRNYLLNAQIIQEPEQFRLGTILISQEEMLRFDLQDWWHTHRDILDEAEGVHKDANAKLREHKLAITPENTVSVFYLVPLIVSKENNYELVDNLNRSAVDVDFWNSIGIELSDDNMDLTLFPPMGVVEAIEQSDTLIQDVEFDIFFDTYASDDGIDIGYIQVAEHPNDYAIFFMDNEDQTLTQFYYYKTEGHTSEFISMLLEKCIEKNAKNLFSFNEKISKDILKEWGTTEKIIEITEFLKQANQIDLKESHRMFMVSNPIGNPAVEGYSSKRTIH